LHPAADFQSAFPGAAVLAGFKVAAIRFAASRSRSAVPVRLYLSKLQAANITEATFARSRCGKPPTD